MSETTTLDAPAPADPAPTNPAPAAPEAAPPADWRAVLPEDLRDAASLKKFNDPGALAKSYVELEKKIGQRGITVPGEGAAPEEIAAYRAAIGVPDKPEGYALKVPEGTPPEAWNDQAAGLLSAWAHDAGLSPQQAQMIAERYAQHLVGQSQIEAAETEATLRAEWGALHERKMAAAKRALVNFVSPELEARLRGTGLLHSVEMQRFLNQIGEAITPHDGSAGMGGGPAGNSLEAERQRYFTPGTPENKAYTNGAHPDHKAAWARVSQIYAEMNGQRR